VLAPAAVLPVVVPVLGVLVVPVTPVPIAVLPPTLPPVVTPVDWACAATVVMTSAAVRIMVLVTVGSSCRRGSNNPGWKKVARRDRQ
jgi:hypothetical protein